MDVEDALTRARISIGEGCKYKLGKGGRRPKSIRPWDSNKECDCSGFTAWVLGIDRKTDNPFYVNYNGGWINTDAMWLDANESVGLFRNLERAETGCFIVYPKLGRKVGHVGFVSSASVAGIPELIIHCSSTNYRDFGDAIQENTGGDLKKNPKSKYIWYEGLNSTFHRLMRSPTFFG